MMDYSGFSNFPFPLAIANSDVSAQKYFYSLDDDKQLEILNRSHSYDSFVDIIRQEMGTE